MSKSKVNAVPAESTAKEKVFWTVAFAFKVLLVLVFLQQTNDGLAQRVFLLLDNGRFGTLAVFLAIWVISAVALLIAALQPSWWVRLGWGLVIAISTAVGWGYQQASQSELTVFDLLSLWNARHEAGRATEFYHHAAMMALGVFAIGLAIVLIPPFSGNGRFSRWLRRLAWVPVVPFLLIGGIVYAKSGGGSQALPSQFTPAALSSLAGAKIALQGTAVRHPVSFTADGTRATRHIVMLIDESVRADYIDLKPGNAVTPLLGAVSDRFVDFGPAASGGNCSNYSNAILRFAASRRDLIGTLNTSPTIWDYAKRAGYRTVYIDAQASANRNPGLLQNFMTATEAGTIDALYRVADVPPEQADEELSDIIAKELASNQPVFIYANKNGAHFPYDHAYPASEALYGPTMTETGTDTALARIASYRNAVAWSVDRFWNQFLKKVDLSNTSLVYTSDHGQIFRPNELSHCTVESPDPRTGFVPMFAYSSDTQQMADLRKAAAEAKGRASHFMIVPTVLSWMGYGEKDLSTVYDESLMHPGDREPAFTSGDIFGLFSQDLRWTSVDLNNNYLEPEGRELESRHVASPEGATLK